MPCCLLLHSDSSIIRIVANWWITNISYFEYQNIRLEVNWNRFFEKIEEKKNVTPIARGNMSAMVKDGGWRGLHVHAGRNWYSVYFDMDLVRYCEGQLSILLPTNCT